MNEAEKAVWEQLRGCSQSSQVHSENPPHRISP